MVQTLQVLFASRSVGGFSTDGRQYPVILQASAENRDSIADMQPVLLRNECGDLIPLSAFVSVNTTATAPAINRYDRMISVDMQADPAEGADLVTAMRSVEEAVAELPAGAVLAWKGQAADYLESSGGVVAVFVMALLIVFLVLAAQFESFCSPVIIMLMVPLGLAGAAIILLMTGGTINIFWQTGLILLIGLMAENGILIIELTLNNGFMPLHGACFGYGCVNGTG